MENTETKPIELETTDTAPETTVKGPVAVVKGVIQKVKNVDKVKNFDKYILRKQYRQDKREMKSNLAISEMKEVGDSENKLKAYKTKFLFKVIKMSIGATLTIIAMFYSPDMIQSIVEKFFGA